jgi:hypothetical protein
MKTAIIEILYDPEVIGFSRSRGGILRKGSKIHNKGISPLSLPIKKLSLWWVLVRRVGKISSGNFWLWGRKGLFT